MKMSMPRACRRAGNRDESNPHPPLPSPRIQASGLTNIETGFRSPFAAHKACVAKPQRHVIMCAACTHQCRRSGQLSHGVRQFMRPQADKGADFTHVRHASTDARQHALPDHIRLGRLDALGHPPGAFEKLFHAERRGRHGRGSRIVALQLRCMLLMLTWYA